MEWLTDHADLLGLSAHLARMSLSEREPTVADWRRLARIIDDALARKRAPSRDALARRLGQLADTVRLSPLDVAILEALLLYETEPVVESLLDTAMSGRRHRHFCAMNLRSGCLPCVLGESHAAVHRRFAPDAPLIRTGLASVDEDQDLSVSHRLRRLAGVVPKGADVRELLLGETRQSNLEWSDFRTPRRGPR